MRKLAFLRPLQRDAGMRVKQCGPESRLTLDQHVKTPSNTPVKMYSWRREERIGLGRGDTAELGTETFNCLD